MTLREKKSQRKAKAIRYLVDTGEYSPAYGSMEAERLNDEGLILDIDYEPLAEYLDELMKREIEENSEQISAENSELSNDESEVEE